MFANLLDNAIRQSPAEGTVTVRAEAVDGFIRFEVIDAGPGFERYFQIPDAPSEGAGMGLFIAREIVQAHGGQLGLESEPGKGAKFWFKLPKVAPPPPG